ncbi:uncharacterized protein [Rutidosis leptorrhynchoides]|uniref:uncharacterized protein n=1 Tax=Rutidosis leptorrhynchoides TaxID=125765 RepID=UPI003A98E105
MTNTYDKIYTVRSISHIIPVKLDLAKLNYSHWKRLFTTHCAGFEVSKFILGTSTAAEQATPEWLKADAVVSTWIYNTISEPLLERLLNSEPASSHVAWTFLENLFTDNKLAKTMELNAELRNLDIGNQSVEEYLRKVDRIATHLRNLGSKVEDNDLVMYAVNGLNHKYPHVSLIIIHQKPFPDFETVRSMLLMEEMTVNRTQKTTETPLNSSHLTALVAQSSTPPPPAPVTETCRNFSKGYCQFENRCRYLHHGPSKKSNSGNNFGTDSRRANGLNQAQLLQLIAAQQQQLAAQSVGNFWAPQVPVYSYGPGPASRPISQAGILSSPHGFNRPVNSLYGPNQLGLTTGPQAYLSGQPTSHASTHQPNTYGSFTVDPRTQTQETILPNAFSAMTLQDYGAAGWHMDTGASSHLTSCINNLSTIFNNCKYPSVAVGNGNMMF